MIVLSLFDGIACGKVALERAGIKITKYYASEVNKWAIQISNKNHPDIIHLGDINNWESWDIDFSKIDLLLAGFPCQAWSNAGNRKGVKDYRGKLALTMMNIFNHVKTLNENLLFLFENVKMSKDFKCFLDDLIGVESIEINSALVSAQNRKRLYWTNIKFNQPADKKIYLKDILESGVVDRDKSYCIDANYYKCGNLKQYFEKSRRQLVFDTTKRIDIIGKGGQGQRIYDTNGKSVALSALGGGQGAKTGLYAVAQRGRNIVNGKRKDVKGEKTQQRFETSFQEKSNCLTSVQKDSYVLDLKENSYIVRKLTPIECERLQNLKDNYTEGISNTQRYKCLGNGWTVDVIAHILKDLSNDIFYKSNKE